MSYEKYFKAMLIIITLSIMFDGVATWFVFSKLGHYQIELNPIMKFFLDMIGIEATLILTRVVGLSIVFVLYEPLKYGGRLELVLMLFLVLFFFALVFINTTAVLKVLIL